MARLCSCFTAYWIVYTVVYLLSEKKYTVNGPKFIAKECTKSSYHFGSKQLQTNHNDTSLARAKPTGRKNLLCPKIEILSLHKEKFPNRQIKNIEWPIC